MVVANDVVVLRAPVSKTSQLLDQTGEQVSQSHQQENKLGSSAHANRKMRFVMMGVGNIVVSSTPFKSLSSRMRQPLPDALHLFSIIVRTGCATTFSGLARVFHQQCCSLHSWFPLQVEISWKLHHSILIKKQSHLVANSLSVSICL